MRALGVRRCTSACLLTVGLALLVAAAPAAADDCPFADATAGTATPEQIGAATVCLINDQRAAFGLRPLTSSTLLGDTATRYAAYMVSTDHFAHMDEDGHNVVYRVLATDPSLTDRWQVIGENLGWGTHSLATPRSMVQAWMSSPAHRANILFADYEEIGVGIAEGAPVPGQTDGLTYTTVFGQLTPPEEPAAAPAPRRAPAKPKKRVKHHRSKNARAAHRDHKRAAHR